MENAPPNESSLDASPLFFEYIRFVRDTLCGKSQDEGVIKGLEDLLDIAVSVLEAEVAIAKAQGKTCVMGGRHTLCSAIDRAEHLTTIKELL